MPKRTAHIFEDKWRSDDVKLRETADFSSLLLSERVLVGLKKSGFKTPSPIQLEAIPVGRFGSDLIVQAKSGTGKTLVFTIIALDLLQDEKQPQVMILAPTREIAFQICDVINSVGSGFKYLKCCAFIGGIPIENDRQSIVGCQIIVGTPGRIKQLLSLKILRSSSIHLLVLDEADQLLENSFKNDIDSIFVSLPKEKQVICTSATYPKTLKKLAVRYFRENPFLARLNVNDLALLGTLHYLRIVEVNLMPVLAYRAKMRALEDVLTNVNFSQCLVFCNVLSKVEAICDDIKTWGFSATYICSAKEQAARLKAIECLKRFKCKILVTSDITSRGIDAENVDLIINIDLPYTTEVYLHRVGRAGRYGSKGLAVTFVSPNEVHSFKKIQVDGNFKSYFLPDPIPANLINQKPDPKAELLKDKDSASESSDEEPSSRDNLPSDSRTIKHRVSKSTGKGATDIENQVLFLNSQNSTNNSNENNTPKDNKDLVGLQSEEICLSENSCIGESVGLLPLDGSSVGTEIGTNGAIGKDGDEIEKSNETESNDLNSLVNSNQKDISTDDEDQSDSLSLEFSISEDSCEEKLADLVILEQTQDKDVIENYSSSSESPNKSKIKEGLSQEEFDNNEVIVPSVRSCNNEESNGIQNISDYKDLLIKLKKQVKVLALTLNDKPADPSDLSVDVLTVADYVSNDGKKCELNGNVELKAEKLCEAVEQSSLVKEEENEVPVTSSIATNPVQVDEVTVSVMNFIHNYEKKSTDSLNGNTVSVKPTESNSSKPKSLVQDLVSDRNLLNDYYYEVFQTYRNENIAGDTAEILELIQDANKLSSAEEKDEKCLITETKENEISKIDLSSWSMKLADNKLNKVELDSTEESTDSSSDCVLESTPIKASKTKSTQLDVSSDTPSFLNPIEDPETDDSSSSEYSNKCSKLKNALKNKIGNRNQVASKHSSDAESTSSSSDAEGSSTSEYSSKKVNKDMDEINNQLSSLRNKCSELKNGLENKPGTGNKGQVSSEHSSGTESSSSSSDTEGSTEVALLERAHREIVEMNDEKQTLVEKAHVLRRVLYGLQSKIPSGRNSKESISDIQITTATHSSKVHDNESASNVESEKYNLLHGSKTRESHSKSSSSLSSSSSLGNVSNAEKYVKAGCSSSECHDKNVNSVQEKYRQFSLSSKTSSDKSESSFSSSSRSNCAEKRRRSKAAKSKSHFGAEKKQHKQCPHESFARADQGNFDVNPPQNSSHANNSYFNHQSNVESSVQPTHEHDISCYMPSQHQCYSLNGHSSCQSQFCATWYDMFYSQWYFIHQHSSYFQ